MMEKEDESNGNNEGLSREIRARVNDITKTPKHWADNSNDNK